MAFITKPEVGGLLLGHIGVKWYVYWTLGRGLYRDIGGYIGIMENQMEENVENDMEIGTI